MQSIQQCFLEMRSQKDTEKKQSIQSLWLDVNQLDDKLKIIEQHKQTNVEA